MSCGCMHHLVTASARRARDLIAKWPRGRSCWLRGWPARSLIRFTTTVRRRAKLMRRRSVRIGARLSFSGFTARCVAATHAAPPREARAHRASASCTQRCDCEACDFCAANWVDPKAEATDEAPVAAIPCFPLDKKDSKTVVCLDWCSEANAEVRPLPPTHARLSPGCVCLWSAWRSLHTAENWRFA